MRIFALPTALLAAVACAPTGAIVGDEPADVPLADTGAGGDDVARSLVLTDLRAYEPYTFEGLTPGDTLRIEARLVNPTDEGWYEYPGVRFETDPPLIAENDGWYGFYGILPRSSLEASWEVVIPEDFAGDTLTVRARMVPLDATFTGGDVTSAEIAIAHP